MILPLGVAGHKWKRKRRGSNWVAYFQTVRDNLEVYAFNNCQCLNLGETKSLMRLRKPNEIVHFELFGPPVW